MSNTLNIDALSGIKAKVILVFLLEAGELTTQQISQRSGINGLKQLRLACDELMHINQLLEQRSGPHGAKKWIRTGILAAWGGALTEIALLGQNDRPEKDVPAQSGQKDRPGKYFPVQGGPKDSSEKEMPAQSGPKDRSTTDFPMQNGQNDRPEREKNAQNGQKDRAERQCLKDSRLKDSRLKESSLDSDLTDSPPQQKRELPARLANAAEPQKRLWLEKASLLFERSVAWEPAFAKKDPLEILAWLAQAYQGWRDQRLEHPWGLVYRALLGQMRQKSPDARFAADPLSLLPREYLEACELALYPCRLCAQEFDSRESLSAHLPDCPAAPAADEDEPEESQDLPEPALSPEEARLADTWKTMLMLLEQDMPRPVFRSYLAETAPLDWDADLCLLRVEARDRQAVDWLESRLKSTVERSLCGVLNGEVHVQFVCEEDLQLAAPPEPGSHYTSDALFGMPLSPTQTRVVRRLVRGQQRSQIALEMGLSVSTVNAHLHAIFAKLGAGNAPEAVARALERGVVC